MRFSRLLLVVAVALPLSACITTAEQLAADDDAACRHAGLKPGTPAYAKCREDRAGQRNMLQAAAMRNQPISAGHRPERLPTNSTSAKPVTTMNQPSAGPPPKRPGWRAAGHRCGATGTPAAAGRRPAGRLEAR